MLGRALFGLFVGIAASQNGVPSIDHGQDFMAFYSAGRLAAEGRAAAMYDLPAMAAAQHAIAADAHFTMSATLAPWLNPPHVAMLFVPFALLPFKAALAAWTIFGIACLAVAGVLLGRIVGEMSSLRRHRWLPIAVVCLAPPTSLALGHGQNTPLSLLLLTLAVVAWRGGRPFLAGLACALLAYKPHLAAIVALGCWLSLGRRVLVGLAVGGSALALATLTFLPGAIEAFVARTPGNMHAIFVERGFRWQQHVTIVGFLRHLLHGNGPGETPAWVLAITALLVGAVAIATLFASWRLRPTMRLPGEAGDAARDRLIALLILATPLLAPYFLDYDLSLLCVAGALIGRELLAREVDARGLRRVAMVTYVWLMLNPLVAEYARVSLTTPMLVALFALHARRCCEMELPRVLVARIAPRRLAA